MTISPKTIQVITENIFTPESLVSICQIFAWLFLFSLARWSRWTIAIVNLPGTALHECLHALVGLILFAKPTSLSLWPKHENGRWILGSVGFRNMNIWNSAPVAFAPLLLIALALLIFQNLTASSFSHQDYLAWLLYGYGVSCCLFSCLPSAEDVKLGGLSALMYCGFAGIVWYLFA